MKKLIFTTALAAVLAGSAFAQDLDADYKVAERLAYKTYPWASQDAQRAQFITDRLKAAERERLETMRQQNALEQIKALISSQYIMGGKL